MPYNPISDGSALTAAHLLAEVYNQVISQVTAATNPAGTEGQFIYETDTNYVRAHNGTSFIPFGQLGGWRTWTPTLTQSIGVTFTTSYAAYSQIGTTVLAFCSLSVTSTGTANNAVTVSLPVTAVAASGWGSGRVFDTSASQASVGLVHPQSTTTISLIDGTAATNNLRLGQTGAAFAAALASGDAVVMGVTYEAA